VILWVLHNNGRARRFDAAAGFRPDGAVKEQIQGLDVATRELRYRRSTEEGGKRDEQR
jgi:hypothetical protein